MKLSWQRGFNQSLHELVRTLPFRTLLPLALAIGALFGVLGPVTDVTKGGRLGAALVIEMTAFSGLIAIGYAFTSMRRNYGLLAAMGAINVVGISMMRHGYFGTFPPLPVEFAATRLEHDGAAILLLTMSSYTLFLFFINGTAARYLRVQAEVDLAHEVHRVLVPKVETRIGDFEFVGLSIPSGEVGGDLVDVVPLDDGWFGYVADVSGHGVSSGVVMAMFKSALRMRLRQGGPMSALLDDLNAVMYPLKNSATYVTVVCVRGTSEGTLEYAVAGHLPILRVGPDGTVDEITTPQIPVGMFEGYAFVSAPLPCEAGDLLALITDGLSEVFDHADRELGIEAIKNVLAAARQRPLQEIADAVLSRARAHGAQIDDQTLLLVRKAEGRR